MQELKWSSRVDWLLLTLLNDVRDCLYIHIYGKCIYLQDFSFHWMDFFSTWQSNSNAEWLTWKWMSNIFKTGAIIIFDFLLCPQFRHKYSIHWKQTAKEERKKHNKWFCIPLTVPKIQRVCVHLQVSTSPQNVF